MLAIDLRLDGDNCWPELAEPMRDGRVIHLGNDAGAIGVAALGGGMVSGKTSVMLRIDLPDGRIVMAETSLALLLAAADAMRVRYPNG
jgi:formylmethanofuran dehydrogenase subunit C